MHPYVSSHITHTEGRLRQETYKTNVGAKNQKMRRFDSRQIQSKVMRSGLQPDNVPAGINATKLHQYCMSCLFAVF